jgi:Integrase core domain.
MPLNMVDDVMQWFHKTLAHPGITQMYNTISQHFTFPGIKPKIEAFVQTCDTCQRTKLSLVDARHIPQKDPEMNPWSQVQVDLVGPWRFHLQITVEAFSAIDLFIGLCKLSHIRNKMCTHISTTFHNVWISHYPMPLFCIHDNGPEFVAQEFHDVLSYYDTGFAHYYS